MKSYTFHHTIADLLRRSYAAHAKSPAFVREDGSETSYAELGELAARVAGGLADYDVKPGDRVLLALRNSPEFFVLDNALFWGGYVRVAVSYRLHGSEIAAIAENASAKVIVVDPEDYTEVVEEVAKRSFETIVVRSTGSEGPVVSDLAAAEAIPHHSSELEDLIWMPYTSGTTGAPKGVQHTQASLMATMRNMLAEFPTPTPGDTLLLAAPMSHLAGWVGIFYAIRGTRFIFLREFEPTHALTVIETYRVTVVPVVPTIVNFLTEAVEQGDFDTSSLRTIIYAGSPMAPDRVARAIKAFGPIFIQCYGATELPMPIAVLSMYDHTLLPDGSVPKHLASAGRVTAAYELRLVDNDGNEVPEGEAGEIQVRSDSVMRAYWNLPEASEEFILESGWRGSGDVGRLEDGYLYIVDRKRDLIVTGGFNVFPSEVEAVISALPGVAEVAVVGVPDVKWGETVLAAIVLDDGSTLDADAVKEACRENLAGYKLPRRIEFLEALPKNSSGKLMRKDLRAQYWEDSDRAVGG